MIKHSERSDRGGKRLIILNWTPFIIKAPAVKFRRHISIRINYILVLVGLRGRDHLTEVMA